MTAETKRLLWVLVFAALVISLGAIVIVVYYWVHGIITEIPHDTPYIRSVRLMVWSSVLTSAIVIYLSILKTYDVITTRIRDHKISENMERVRNWAAIGGSERVQASAIANKLSDKLDDKAEELKRDLPPAVAAEVKKTNGNGSHDGMSLPIP